MKRREEEEDEPSFTNLSVIKYVEKQLANDGLTLSDPTFRQMMDEAIEQMDNTSGFKAERYFIYHENPTISKAASDLVAEPYQLSKIHNKTKKLETDGNRLFELVPRVVMDFKFKVISHKIKELQDKLKTPMGNDELIAIMTELQTLQKVNRALASHLGEIVYLPNSRF